MHAEPVTLYVYDLSGGLAAIWGQQLTGALTRELCAALFGLSLPSLARSLRLVLTSTCADLDDPKGGR